MPGISGGRFLRLVRGSAQLNALAVVLVTGEAHEEMGHLGRTAQADAILPKRMVNTDLAPMVRQLVSARSPKVLIVDDSPLTVSIARTALQGMGYEVVVREDSLGTLGAIASTRPDFVLLDVMLPGLSGDALADLIKGNTLTRGAHVVLHSVLPQDELTEMMSACGAFGCIVKTKDTGDFSRQFHAIEERARAADRRSSSPGSAGRSMR